MTKTALIVGASRGLGLGLVKEYLQRGWSVIATERKSGSAAPLHALKSTHANTLRIEAIDINEPAQITALHEKLGATKLDLLYVNAGVIDDLSAIGEVTTEEFTRLMVTNALSPLRVVEGLSDLVQSRGSIAVMTSGLGSVGGNTTGGYETYRASKAALNMLMRSYAARAGGSRSLLCIHPGHVKTDMGGDSAPLSVETSAKGIYDTIAAHEHKKGLAFLSYANQTMPW